MAGAAEGVEPADLLRVERARPGVDRRVVAVGEGVLRVELDLVDLERGQQIDEPLQAGRGRDLVPRDVEHDAPHRQVRMVGDAAHRQRPVVDPGQLGQGGPAVERPGVVGRHQLDAVGPDAQLVALRRQRPVDAGHR